MTIDAAGGYAVAWSASDLLQENVRQENSVVTSSCPTSSCTSSLRAWVKSLLLTTCLGMPPGTPASFRCQGRAFLPRKYFSQATGKGASSDITWAFPSRRLQVFRSGERGLGV